MNHYPFIYQILVCHYDADEGQVLRHRCAGLGFADSYADAVAQIEDREGADLECIEHVEIIGERNQNLIDIDPKWVPDLIHNEDLFWGEDLSNPPCNYGIRKAKHVQQKFMLSNISKRKEKRDDL